MHNKKGTDLPNANMKYIVANPTGNITILVTTDVPQSERLAVVREMFEKEPTCEQVGFISVLGPKRIRLEMMGGEFCGNATMSAAAYLASLNAGEQNDEAGEKTAVKIGDATTITVEASGADEPVEVEIIRNAEVASADGKIEKSFTGTLEMPMPELGSIEYKNADGASIQSPIVHLDGISHMIVPVEGAKTGGESNSDSYKTEMESSIKSIADEIGVPALGMIRYESLGSDVAIEPLVYVKGSDTLVWENGCASGSIAAAFYRYKTEGAAETAVRNPGGVLKVAIEDGKLFITGTVKL